MGTDMDKLRNQVLHTGVTRAEYLRRLGETFSQPRVDYAVQGHKCALNLPYAAGSGRQKIDIYYPEGEGPFPVILSVHGGAWFMGSRSDHHVAYLLPFLRHGYAVAPIGYRLADEAVFPQPVEDVSRAIAFVEQNAALLCVDAGRMGMYSGSAGTPIASVAALKTHTVKAVLLLCPILDFASMTRQFGEIGLARERFDPPELDTSIEALYLGGSVEEMKEAARAANPAEYLSGDAPHFLLMHGMADIDTPYPQSVEFARRVRAATGDEGRARVELLADTGHDNGLFDTQETFQKKLDFFDTYVKNA